MKKSAVEKCAAGAACGVSSADRERARAAFDTWVAVPDHVRGLESSAALADVRGDVEPAAAVVSGGSDYELAARAFLVATAARFSARYLGDFDSVEEWGENETGAARCGVRGLLPVWRVRIATAAGSMVVRFRGSINDGRRGVVSCSVYSVLACLCKHEPGAFDDFAHEFGYFPIESAAAFRHARRVWRGCIREFAGVCRVWGESDRARLVSIN